MIPIMKIMTSREAQAEPWKELCGFHNHILSLHCTKVLEIKLFSAMHETGNIAGGNLEKLCWQFWMIDSRTLSAKMDCSRKPCVLVLASSSCQIFLSTSRRAEKRLDKVTLHNALSVDVSLSSLLRSMLK